MYSTVPSPPAAPWNSAHQSPSLERTMNASSTPPISPTSPTRRLRGLSYLRSYTQNHILSRDSHNHSSTASNNNTASSQQRPSSLARATSYPSPSNRGSAIAPNSLTAQDNPTSPTTPRTPSEVPSTTSGLQAPGHDSSAGTAGWLPTVEGQSGISRIPTEPQATSASSAAASSGNNIPATDSEQTGNMARTRSATLGAVLDLSRVEAPAAPPAVTNGGGNNNGMSHQLPSIRFMAHQDARAVRPSLVFVPMARILPTGQETIKVGRYSERENQPTGPTNVPSAAPVGFKSKVVSRRHCEFWCSGGTWYIRDVKSSSGTFLNHIRLSSPGTESRPFRVNDGDIVQLGIDFKGGEEMIFRCVKIRVELNKGWQTGPSNFNMQSHKRLRELNNLSKSSGSPQDCSICLGPIAPCQSLFVAPCSHTWHYKCIRQIINGPTWPTFMCPNCRTLADLDAEIDDPVTSGEWEEIEAEDVVQPPQPAEPEPTPQREQPEFINHSEGPANLPASDIEGAQHLSANDLQLEEPGAPSDLELSERGIPSDDADVSDESDVGQLSYTMSNVHMNGLGESSATTPPVDIISRKPVGSSSSSSRLAQQDTRSDRHTTRTPSPSGLTSSLDVAAGVEGPMTPRNDAGPFIFDGSAGRASGIRLTVAANNLAAAADTPPRESTPYST